jgi:hypothetical protein
LNCEENWTCVEPIAVPFKRRKKIVICK